MNRSFCRFPSYRSPLSSRRARMRVAISRRASALSIPSASSRREIPRFTSARMVRSTTGARNSSIKSSVRLGFPGRSLCAEQFTITRPLDLVTVPTLAARLGVSHSYLIRLVQTGQVPALRVTGDYLLPADTRLPPRTCQRCGADLGRAKADRKWCDACRLAWKRERQRAAYAHARERDAIDRAR